MNQEVLQVIIAKISALAALGGSVIGALATLASTWLAKHMQEKGSVSVFCRLVASKPDGREFGIYQSGDGTGMIMRIPMWIEVCNTSGISRFIRDINVVGCIGKKEVCEFIQFQGNNLGKENEILYGNNQAYTFVVEGNSTRRFQVEFAVKQFELSEEDRNIDSLWIRYYDEKNRKHIKEFYKITDNPIWSIRKFDYKKRWFEASGKKSVL